MRSNWTIIALLYGVSREADIIFVHTQSRKTLKTQGGGLNHLTHPFGTPVGRETYHEVRAVQEDLADQWVHQVHPDRQVPDDPEVLEHLVLPADLDCLDFQLDRYFQSIRILQSLPGSRAVR